MLKTESLERFKLENRLPERLKMQKERKREKGKATKKGKNVRIKIY